MEFVVLISDLRERQYLSAFRALTRAFLDVIFEKFKSVIYN